MSLFKWSTPERRSMDRVLPIIPNEIYFCILEHVALPTERLTPEELQIFTNLSCVCRFFANICLPRIFEFLEFSGIIFRNDTPTYLRNDATYRTSRESTLCAQLAGKQPLALALAKMVRTCRFSNWKLDGTGSWAVRLFASKYINGMVHMVNVRKVTFSNSFVDAEHWRMIAALPALEELSFDWCKFLHGPADVVPGRRVRVKVSRLRVVNCSGLRQVVAAMDVQSLRTLFMDFLLFEQIDWLSESTLTELCLCRQVSWVVIPDLYVERLHAFLVQAPPSLEALELFLDVMFGLSQDFSRSVFDDPAWRNLPRLRSLTLRVRSVNLTNPADIFSSALEGVGLLTNIQAFTLKDSITYEISPTEIRRILGDKLGPASDLNYVNIYGRALRLVDGEWSEMSSRTV